MGGSQQASSAVYRDLYLGIQGEDVRLLQKTLNNLNFTVSLVGAGSKGNEITYFGPATKSAVIKYQASKGIPATGYVGSLTRAKLFGQIIQSTTQPVLQGTGIKFTLPLDIGARNAEVTALQTYLISQKFLLTSATGYFGPATAKAVGLFQEKYNLAKPTDVFYGFVGVKTRAKLNEFVK
jgi:peptidoglycan hydrolase-like protein with peptidoglycan-binding domain